MARNNPEPAEGAEVEPVAPEAVAEEAPVEEEAVDPELHDYRDVEEGVQARVMTDSERSLRAVS